MLFEEAQFLSNARSWVGLSILGILVIATAIAVPILQAAGLVYQWFMPLTQKGRRRFSVLNEILRAWQYIEAYLIALFVASWWVLQMYKCKVTHLLWMHLFLIVVAFLYSIIFQTGNSHPYQKIWSTSIVGHSIVSLRRWSPTEFWRTQMRSVLVFKDILIQGPYHCW